MRFPRLAVLLLPLFLTACGLSPQQKADYSSVQSSGVTPAIYDKMVHGDDLSIYDIKALARAHVNDGIILRYLRDRQTIYYLNTADVEGLRKAGVSESIVDYMLQTPKQYGPNTYPYPYPYGDDPYFYRPYWGNPYWGPYPVYYRHRY